MRAQEIRYLSNRVEDLERRLRQKTLSLTGALGLGGLLAITAAALAVVPRAEPEPPRVTQVVAPVPEAPAAPPAAGEADAAGRTDRALAAVPPDGSGWPDGREEAAGEGSTTAGPAGGRVAVRDDTGGDAELRAALTAAEARIAELEAAGVRYEGTVAELRAELEGARAEARALGEQLQVGRRGIDELNAMLAATVAGTGGGRGAGEEGRPVGRGAANGVEPPGVAPADAPAGASPAVDGGDGAQAGGAPSYAAIRAVNVRAAPSNAADVLAVVAQGDVVRRIGNQGGWLRVEYDDRRGGDVTGWVHGQHLRRVEAPSEGTGPSARADD